MPVGLSPPVCDRRRSKCATNCYGAHPRHRDTWVPRASSDVTSKLPPSAERACASCGLRCGPGISHRPDQPSRGRSTSLVGDPAGSNVFHSSYLFHRLEKPSPLVAVRCPGVLVLKRKLQKRVHVPDFARFSGELALPGTTRVDTRRGQDFMEQPQEVRPLTRDPSHFWFDFYFLQT